MTDEHKPPTEQWISLGGDDPNTRYKMPNPTTERSADAIYAARYNPERMTRDQGVAVAEICETYSMLLTHPAGPDAMAGKVRAAWIAICGEWHPHPTPKPGEG